jgi:hypothetical protein
MNFALRLRSGAPAQDRAIDNAMFARTRRWREGVHVMNAITKFAAKAALAGGLAIAALAAATPADAGVHVGIGIGVPVAAGPVYAGDFCAYHPHKCGYRAGYYAGPRIGVFYAGRGYWDGHRYWGHRYWGHGGWRFR